MIAVQIGIVIFLLVILLIVYQDERRKKRLERKSAKLSRFWEAGKERRKSVRIDTELNVAYEVVADKSALRRSSVTRNISVGGVNLALDEKLFPGTTLELELSLPQRPRPVLVQGKIVWLKEISPKFGRKKEQRFFAAGIQFTRINAQDEAALKDFISRKIKDTQDRV